VAHIETSGVSHLSGDSGRFAGADVGTPARIVMGVRFRRAHHWRRSNESPTGSSRKLVGEKGPVRSTEVSLAELVEAMKAFGVPWFALRRRCHTRQKLVHRLRYPLAFPHGLIVRSAYSQALIGAGVVAMAFGTRRGARRPIGFNANRFRVAGARGITRSLRENRERYPSVIADIRHRNPSQSRRRPPIQRRGTRALVTGSRCGYRDR